MKNRAISHVPNSACLNIISQDPLPVLHWYVSQVQLSAKLNHIHKHMVTPWNLFSLYQHFKVFLGLLCVFPPQTETLFNMLLDFFNALEVVTFFVQKTFICVLQKVFSNFIAAKKLLLLFPFEVPVPCQGFSPFLRVSVLKDPEQKFDFFFKFHSIFES